MNEKLNSGILYHILNIFSVLFEHVTSKLQLCKIQDKLSLPALNKRLERVIYHIDNLKPIKHQ